MIESISEKTILSGLHFKGQFFKVGKLTPAQSVIVNDRYRLLMLFCPHDTNPDH